MHGEGQSVDLGRWIPASYLSATKDVEWQEVGNSRIHHHSIQQLLQASLKTHPERRRRPLRELLLLSGKDEIQLQPAGLIFHVSRCGADLLTSAVRGLQNVQVISEAPVINQLLNSDRDNGGVNEASLREMMRAFSRWSGAGTPTIWKLTSWNLLDVEYFLQAWPGVPCIAVVRDPLEVLLSWLTSPPRWLLHGKVALAGPRMHLGKLSLSTNLAMWARILGALMLRIEQHLSPNFRFVDYAELSNEIIGQVGDLFGLEVEEFEVLPTEIAAGLCATDPEQSGHGLEEPSRVISAEREAARKAIEQWVSPVYARILQSPHRLLRGKAPVHGRENTSSEQAR